MTWQIGAALNAVIGGSYLVISWLIWRGLWRTGQLRDNTLALATGMIFFTCGVHHGGHALHMLLPVLGLDRGPGLAMRHAFTWQMDVWDVVGAFTAVFYLTLRRSYGRVLNRPAMFPDVERERYERRLERERASLAEAQAIAHIGSWTWEPRGEVTTWSEELYRIFGRDPAEGPAVGEAYLDYVHEGDRPRVRHEYGDSVLLGESFEISFRIRRRDGEVRHLHVIGHGDGPGRYAGTVQDLTGLRRAEEALREAEEHFRGAFEEAPVGMALVGLDGRMLRVNRALGEIVGRSDAELLGLMLGDLTHPEDVELDAGLRRRMLAGEIRTYQLEKRILHRRGEHVWVSMSASLVAGGDGPAHLIVQVEDIGDRRRMLQALHAAEERLRVTVAHAPIGVALVDLNGLSGGLLSVNRALQDLLGYGEGELLEMTLTSILHPDDAAVLARELPLLAGDDLGRIELEARCLRPDGQQVWVLLTGAGVPGEEGSPRYAVFHAIDIGERKRFEGQLQYLADHDALTGLFNRRRFEAELDRTLAHARRYGRRGAVLLLDLDGFKHVNDTLGHSYGDELLTRIGGGLRRTLRESDVIARLGGDEFAVILMEATANEARVVGGKVLEMLQEEAIVPRDGRHTQVTGSIGVTTFSPEDAATSEELVVEADIAMYEAKEKGKNQISAYDRATSASEGLASRKSWIERLRLAVRESRFELMAQPVRRISRQGIDRYELLLRMRGDDGELIPPGTFLYIAERLDLIQEIDRWVFGEAVRLLRAHAEQGHDISLSVNMSGRTLGDPRLMSDVARILADAPIPPGRLVIEVTETAAIVNIERARAVARELRELGCQFALDDFGAGFASFYYLKHLDFDYLKIDGEFIKSLTQNATDQLVVRSVVEIARGLGAETIAEFVGSDATLRRLEQLGVDYGQGFFLGRPEPVERALPALVPA